jgi:hypothetical protein
MIPHLQEFIPYDMALKLNKLGYHNQTLGYYNIYSKHMFFSEHTLHSEAIWAPSYEQVLYWLQTVHNKDVNPDKKSITESISKISLKR